MSTNVIVIMIIVGILGVITFKAVIKKKEKVRDTVSLIGALRS